MASTKIELQPTVEQTAEHEEVVVKHGFRRMLGALYNNPDYRLYWMGNQAGTLTMQMIMIARGYLAFELTGSAAILGLVALANGASNLLFSPIGGVLADRLPKRKVLMVVQSCLCVSAVILGILIQTGLIQWWHLLITGLFEGVLFAINMPTRRSFVPTLVTDEDLPNAIALDNSGLNASRIVGPALAGILIAVPFVGLVGVFYLRAVAFLWVLWTLWHLPADKNPGTKKRNSMLQDFTEGIKYIWTHETLLPLFSMAVMIMIFGMSYQILLPVFALEVLKVGSTGQGFMSAMIGVGALTGSLTMAYFSRAKQRGRMQMMAGVGLGVSLTIFALAAGAHLFALVLAVLIFVGFSNDFYSTINNTLIMFNSDRSMYGRMMSVYMMTWSLNSLVSAPVGVLADHFGASAVIAVSGVILTIFMIIMGSMNKRYRAIN